jgi:hypothetical protein
VRISSPVNTSGGNTYTVNVPAGSNYFLFGILDQNNNGLIDAGDVSNTDNNGSNSTLIVSGNLTGQNVALPATDIAATVQTQYQVDFFWNGTSSQTSTLYQLNFDLREGNKLPVAVQLASASNPNVVTPVDIGNLCQGCGHPQFQLYDQIGMDVPVANDSYTFNVTYSDGTTGTAMGKVTSVLGASALATNLAPQQTNSTSTTPTFTWTYPANASSYIYSFLLILIDQFAGSLLKSREACCFWVLSPLQNRLQQESCVRYEKNRLLPSLDTRYSTPQRFTPWLA